MKNNQSDSPKPRHKAQAHGDSPRTGRMMLFILLGLALCIVVFFVVAFPIVMRTSESDATVRIPRDADTGQVRDTLEKYFGSKYASSVIWLASVRNIDLSKRNGAYAIPAGTSAFSAMRKLTSGAQTPVKITINGFRSMPLMIERIARKMEFPPDSLQAVLSDEAFLANYGLTPENAMALFIDDSYEVYWNTPARDLVRKIGENYQNFWNDTRTAKARSLGLTPAEVMIVASITDEESNVPAEKSIIGRLYINRLDKSMRLQADPTVRYALGDFTIRRITMKDLKTDSPYNTYIHAGLPPGPIRTTSRKTVEAILDAKPHDYIYMCAKEDFSGTHNFATTYSRHLENAARYQEALDRRGIKR